MKQKFVNTTNTRAFLSAVSALQQRGAGEACLMVIDGKPGLGKTFTVKSWSTDRLSVYIRVTKEVTPCWLMKMILEAMNKTPASSIFERLFKQVVEELRKAVELAQQSDEDFAVIIDEVDNICRSARILETLRDLSDLLEIPFIFVGMGQVRQNLVRFPQIASRIGQYVTFAPLTRDDVRKLIDELCEVKVADDLVDYLHKMSKGLAREIKEGIANIERFGRKNPPGGDGLTVKDMSGQILMNDRETGRPIVVRV